MNKNDLIKPKNPRSATHQAAINATGAGAHKDKKKAMKQGEVKHKKQDYAESLQQMLESVLRDKEDYIEKSKTIDTLGRDKNVDQKAVQQRRLDLEKEAKAKGIKEHADDKGEYDDEAGMAKNNLHTIARMCKVLHNELADNENLPEWVEEKISQAKGMMVTVTDYMISQHEHGDTHLTDAKAVKQRLDPKCWKGKHKEGTKIKGGVRVNNCVPNEDVEETAAWQKSSGKNKNGGLNKKGVASYRREHPGSKLQTAVTKKPSELKPGSKAAKRRKSFCARMKGMKKSRTSAKTAHDPNSRINKSLRKWHCESVEEMAQMIVNAQKFLAESKQKKS